MDLLMQLSSGRVDLPELFERGMKLWTSGSRVVGAISSSGKDVASLAVEGAKAAVLLGGAYAVYSAFKPTVKNNREKGWRKAIVKGWNADWTADGSGTAFYKADEMKHCLRTLAREPFLFHLLADSALYAPLHPPSYRKLVRCVVDYLELTAELGSASAPAGKAPRSQSAVALRVIKAAAAIRSASEGFWGAAENSDIVSRFGCGALGEGVGGEAWRSLRNRFSVYVKGEQKDVIARTSMEVYKIRRTKKPAL